MVIRPFLKHITKSIRRDNMRLFSAVFMVLLSVTLFAADVDFSGTWKFDKEKSEIPEFGGGRGGGRDRGNFTPPDMVIIQKKNKITVERTRIGRDGEERKTETVYDLKGKVTKDKSRRGTTEHVAKMKDDVLVIESIRFMEREGQEFEMVTNTNWTLVDDGNGLLIESVTETPMGERTMKTYYAKQ
jgi:hypothetical protein